MSAVAEHDFVVHCTPEEAFDYLIDLRNELEWNADDCESMEKITMGPLSQGTKFRAKWKGAPPIVVEITEFDRPRSWRARSGGSMESDFTATVQPHPEGARVMTRLELTPRGLLFRIIFPIFKMVFNKSEANVPKRITTALNERFGDSPAGGLGVT